MVFFRKIFILQLVGLVLTYNFRDCDFERIRKDYENIIFEDLNGVYINENTCIHCNVDSCDSPPDCLTKIERLTFSNRRCKSLAKKTFVLKTNATLTQRCPGYSGMQGDSSKSTDGHSEVYPYKKSVENRTGQVLDSKSVINNTQAMKRRTKREDTKHACLEIASNLIGLWGRFLRS